MYFRKNILNLCEYEYNKSLLSDIIFQVYNNKHVMLVFVLIANESMKQISHLNSFQRDVTFSMKIHFHLRY